MDITNHSVSIVIPVVHEAQNIPELVRRLAALNLQPPFEMILVDDDSQDGTIEVVHHLQATHPWLRIIIRQHHKGLCASVLEGFKQARYQNLIAMDGDLSHPPEKIPELLAELIKPNTDFVIGSRYIAQGTINQAWSTQRRLTSKISASITRLILGQPIQDPLSGFFAVKKDKLRVDKLNAIGWRMGVEIITKCHLQTIKEVPIHFSCRYKGKSKLNLKNIFADIWHLQQLFFYKIFSKI